LTSLTVNSLNADCAEGFLHFIELEGWMIASTFFISSSYRALLQVQDLLRCSAEPYVKGERLVKMLVIWAQISPVAIGPETFKKQPTCPEKNVRDRGSRVRSLASFEAMLPL